MLYIIVLISVIKKSEISYMYTYIPSLWLIPPTSFIPFL